MGFLRRGRSATNGWSRWWYWRRLVLSRLMSVRGRVPGAARQLQDGQWAVGLGRVRAEVGGARGDVRPRPLARVAVELLDRNPPTDTCDLGPYLIRVGGDVVIPAGMPCGTG